MNLVSIIIPVYNTELYIESCLFSILDQTHANIEVIVVNDGSTDSSPVLCNVIAESDIRVKVLHTLNHGVSHARNKGIEFSKGDFIMFVDADDKLIPEAVEVMVKAAIEYDTDLVVTAFEKDNMETGKTEKHDMKYSGLFDTKSVKTKILSECFFGKNKNNLDTSCWAKLFRRELIVKYNLKFDPLLKYGEDTLFVFEYLLTARNSLFLNKFFPYIYVIHKYSVSDKFELNRYHRRKYIVSKYHEKLGEDFKLMYNRVYFLMMLDAYYPLSHVSYTENKMLVKYELKTMLQDADLNNSIKFVDRRTLSPREKLLLFLIKRNYMGILLLLIKGKNIIYNFQK